MDKFKKKALKILIITGILILIAWILWVNFGWKYAIIPIQ